MFKGKLVDLAQTWQAASLLGDLKNPSNVKCLNIFPTFVSTMRCLLSKYNNVITPRYVDFQRIAKFIISLQDNESTRQRVKIRCLLVSIPTSIIQLLTLLPLHLYSLSILLTLSILYTLHPFPTLLHHSITPSLHHSITPLLHHSITPLLHSTLLT